MRIKLNKNKNPNLTWDELEYGDVFKYKYGSEETYVGMKICDNVSSDFSVDLLLDLTDFEVYSDVEMYNIVETIKCSLIEDDEE